MTTAGRNLENINPIKIRLQIKNNLSTLFWSPHIPKTQSKLIKSDEKSKNVTTVENQYYPAI